MKKAIKYILVLGFLLFSSIPAFASGVLPGWVPVLVDEFYGNTLNVSQWYDHDPQWLAGSPPSCFCPPMVQVSDGTLKLWLYYAPEWLPSGYAYASSAIKSKVNFLYGKVEARIKYIDVEGASSGFWMYNHQPSLWTEIGIAECWRNYGQWHGSVHRHIPAPHYEQSFWASIGSYTAWHTHVLEWSAERIEMYVDGAKVVHIENLCWHQPLPVMFSIQTYGGWLPLPAPASLPKYMEVDWVRVWRKR